MIFTHLVWTSLYQLGRYMPLSPSTKELHEWAFVCLSVWPDVAKFRHFTTTLKTLAILKGFKKYLPKFFAYFGKFNMLLGKLSLLKMEKY